jgi:hypothetical protein
MRQATAVSDGEILDKIVKMGPIVSGQCPFCQQNSCLLCVHTVALVRSVLANESVCSAPRDPRRRHVSWLYNQLKAPKTLKWLQAEREQEQAEAAVAAAAAVAVAVAEPEAVADAAAETAHAALGLAGSAAVVTAA